MVGNTAFQSQPAEPAVRQVEIDLLAQPPLGADAASVADDQHADHQFRIDRGATDRAVKRRQSLPQTAKVEKTVDLSQHVIGRKPIFEAKHVKKRRLTVALLPHHATAPDPPQQNRITGDSGLQPTFSTKSANSSHPVAIGTWAACHRTPRFAAVILNAGFARQLPPFVPPRAGGSARP